MEIGVHLRKCLMLSIRISYRSAHSHPFAVGILFLIFLLYRFLPSVFGFFLSSSPVLVCTFVLLGTLLSFGHPNIPEIDEEEEEERDVNEEENKKNHHDISSLKAEFVEGDFFVQRDESFSVETHVGSNKEIEQTVLDEKVLTFPTTSLGGVFITGRSIETNTTSGDDGLIRGRSIVLEKEIHGQVSDEKRDYYSPKFIEKREFYDLEFAQNREFSEMKPLMEGVAVGFNDEELENVETDNPVGELQSTNLGHPFASAQDSLSWRQTGDHDESYDSGSDGAESSSPDASMTDIIPMLDELHPLLNVEHPQAALISLDDDSDAASERSHVSSGENVESGDEEDIVNHEEEDMHHGVREDETEAVVTWTEDDEKNLMDLGNSELERNRRLESLIARRRTRNSFRMLEAEKNMIDFDSMDLPFQIAPVSTARRNPFDLHYDSNMGIGLLPIPGSAPSILIPRRNPFDLPYDPHEERPNVSGGSFIEEYTSALGKDYFKRHESFHLGASYFAHEKHDTKFRPYFVPEKMASGSMGYSTFHRQMSELSDSKMSSATESESISSVAYQEDHNNIVQEESCPREMVSLVDHTPYHVIQENQYAEEVHFDQEDTRDPELARFESTFEEIESSSREHSSMHYTQFITSPVESTTNNVHVKPQVVEKQYTRSNSSSSSEEKIFDVNIEEELAHLETPRGGSMEYSRSFVQPQAVNTGLSSRVRERLDNRQTEEPVYDLSPSATEKNLSGMTNIVEALSDIIDRRVFASTSYIESDMLVEVSEVGSTSASLEGIMSLTDEESLLHNGSIKTEMSFRDERTWEASPEVSAVDDNEPTSGELTMFSEPSVSRTGFSDVTHNSDDHLVATVPPLVVEKVVSYWNSSSSSSSSATESEEVHSLSEKACLRSKLDQVPQSGCTPIHVGIHLSDVDDKVDRLASSYSDGESSASLPSIVSEKQLPSLEMEKTVVQQSSDGECEESQDISIPSEMSTKDTSVIDNVDEPLVEVFSNVPQSPPETADKFTKETAVITNDDEPKVEDFSNLSHPASEPAYFVSEVPKNFPIPLYFDDDRDEIQWDSKLRNLDLYQETIGSHASEEEFNEGTDSIKDIDDGLLSELDAVGDFSFEELRTSSDQVLEVHGSLTGLHVVEVASDDDISDKLAKHETTKGSSDKPIDLEFRTYDFEVEDRSVEVNSTFKNEVPEASFANVIEPLHDEFQLKVAEDEHPEIAVFTREPNLMETDLEPPVLESRSSENHDSTVKQLDKGEMEKSVLEPIHDESVPANTDVGLAVIESPIHYQNQTETTLELPVVEARSLEEIDSAFKKLGEEEAGELVVEEPESEYVVTKHGLFSTRISLELPVVESAFLEDIDSAFKQFGEQAVEQNIIEAVHHEMILEENATESPEIEASEGSDNKLIELRFWADDVKVEDRSVEVNIEDKVPEAVSAFVIDPYVKSEELEESISVEPLHDEFLFKVAEDEHLEIAVSSQERNLTETDLKLPVLVDHNSTLKQLGKGEMENYVLEPIHKESVLQETEVEDAVIESLTQYQNSTVTNLELPVVEARSLEEIDLAFKKVGEQETDELVLKEPEPESVVPNHGQISTGTSLELPVIEAASLEDIDLAFKQFGNQEAVETTILEAVHNEIILEETAVDSAEIEVPSQHQVPTETCSELQVVEATSLEDVDSSFRQFEEKEADETDFRESVHRESMLEETEVESAVYEVSNQDQRSTETSLELPVAEATFLEDIHLAFKQLGDTDSKSVVYEPVMKESIIVNPEAGPSVFEEPNEDAILTKRSLELPIYEARSLEGTDSGFKQLHEGEHEDFDVLEPIYGEPILEETEVEESVMKQNLVGSTLLCKENQNPIEISLGELPILEARSVQDIDSAFKKLREIDSEKSIILEAGYNESVPIQTEVKTPVIQYQDENPRETSPERLPVIEARSVEDIDSALKQHCEAKYENSIVLEAIHDESTLEETQVSHAALLNQDQVPGEAIESTTYGVGESEFDSPTVYETFQTNSKLDDSETQSANPREEPSKSEFDLVVPVLGMRPLEHDDSSFGQLSEKGDDEKPIHELIDNKPRVLDSLDSSDIRSDLQVHEEKSVVDTHSPAEKLSEGKLEDLLKPSGSNDILAEDLVKDKESSEVHFEESVKQETGTAIEESEHGHKETHGIQD